MTLNRKQHAATADKPKHATAQLPGLRPIRVHAAGSSAVLMDVSDGAFDLATQRHLWFLCARDGPLTEIPGVHATVLGVNNLLVRFDPLQIHPLALFEVLQQTWRTSRPQEDAGSQYEIPVLYDTSQGADMEFVASHTGLSVREVIAQHSSVEYLVACIGSVPGFAYLVGLPPRLAVPRRAIPRAQVPKGAVMIGGAQTGVIPMDMPSGWHTLGMTDLTLFDPYRAAPCLWAPGDRIRFKGRGAPA